MIKLRFVLIASRPAAGSSFMSETPSPLTIAAWSVGGLSHHSHVDVSSLPMSGLRPVERQLDRFLAFQFLRIQVSNMDAKPDVAGPDLMGSFPAVATAVEYGGHSNSTRNTSPVAICVRWLSNRQITRSETTFSLR